MKKRKKHVSHAGAPDWWKRYSWCWW